MTDDIVTQLRKACQYEDGYQLTMAPELVSAIADEIEYLRNEVKLLQEQEKRLNLQILANFKSIDAMHKELYGDD